MKQYSLFIALVHLGALLINLDISAHGFDRSTYIKSADEYYILLDNLYMSTDPEYYQDKEPEEQDYVLSYDTKTNRYVKRRVISAGTSKTDCFFKIGFDCIADFKCTPMQEFYLPEKKAGYQPLSFVWAISY